MISVLVCPLIWRQASFLAGQHSETQDKNNEWWPVLAGKQSILEMVGMGSFKN